MMASGVPSVQLSSGASMPMVGLGTWKVRLVMHKYIDNNEKMV